MMACWKTWRFCLLIWTGESGTFSGGRGSTHGFPLNGKSILSSMFANLDQRDRMSRSLFGSVLDWCVSGFYLSPDSDFYSMRIQIRFRIQVTKMMQIYAHPDPQHCDSGPPSEGWKGLFCVSLKIMACTVTITIIQLYTLCRWMKVCKKHPQMLLVLNSVVDFLWIPYAGFLRLLVCRRVVPVIA